MLKIIPWILAGLSKLFNTKAGGWIVSAMMFLGIGFATNEFAIGPLLDQIKAMVSGVGGVAIEWLAFFNIDKYITCILSAYATSTAKNVVLRRMTR